MPGVIQGLAGLAVCRNMIVIPMTFLGATESWHFHGRATRYQYTASRANDSTVGGMGLDVDAINDLHFRFNAHCGLLNLFASSSTEQGGVANARDRFHALGLLLVHVDKPIHR